MQHTHTPVILSSLKSSSIIFIKLKISQAYSPRVCVFTQVDNVTKASTYIQIRHFTYLQLRTDSEHFTPMNSNIEGYFDNILFPKITNHLLYQPQPLLFLITGNVMRKENVQFETYWLYKFFEVSTSPESSTQTIETTSRFPWQWNTVVKALKTNPTNLSQLNDIQALTFLFKHKPFPVVSFYVSI